MTPGNSANAVTIVRQRERGPHIPHQILTLEQTNSIPQDFIIRILGSSLEGTAWETMYQTSKREVSHAVLDALELLCWRDALWGCAGRLG